MPDITQGPDAGPDQQQENPPAPSAAASSITYTNTVIQNVPPNSALGYTLSAKGVSIGVRRTDGILPPDAGLNGGTYSVNVDDSLGADEITWDTGGTSPAFVSSPLTITIPAVPFDTIVQSVGWVPTARVRLFDSLGNPVTFDAATLTITTPAGEAVYGPASGIPAAASGGFLMMTWPDAATLPSGTYAFSLLRTINGAGQPRITGTLVLSAPAPAISPPPPVYPISLAGIKAKLVGLDSWLQAAARQETPYDDARIIANIPAMLRGFERATTVQLRATQVITRDDGTYTRPDPNNPGSVIALNGLPIYKEEAYTYYPQSAFDYFITNLKTRPVQEIQRCRILFGNTTVLAIPSEWYELDTQSGAFQILPVQGSLLFAEYSSSFALLQQGFQNRNFIPHVVHFDYVAGLPLGWETDYNNADLVRLLEEYCALAVLNDIAYLADAGLTGKSISGGGSGESYSYDRFMQRKKELQDNVDAFKMLWKDQQSPVMMMGA